MTTERRTFTLSARKLCNLGGKEYAAQFIGQRAVYTTWDGEELIGTIESFTSGDPFPVIRFDDGRWARSPDLRITILKEVD